MLSEIILASYVNLEFASDKRNPPALILDFQSKNLHKFFNHKFYRNTPALTNTKFNDMIRFIVIPFEYVFWIFINSFT